MWREQVSHIDVSFTIMFTQHLQLQHLVFAFDVHGKLSKSTNCTALSLQTTELSYVWASRKYVSIISLKLKRATELSFWY